MIYFTADTHFDHGNIIRFCNRPFATVEEMNETLISNWNRKVHANDTVFVMGDMFFRTTDPEPILQRLKGKKHLIVGNHDSQWMKKVDMGRWFESVQSYLETNDGQHTITMCHFPMVTWNHQSRRVIEKSGYSFVEKYTMYFDELDRNITCFSYVF